MNQSTAPSDEQRPYSLIEHAARAARRAENLRLDGILPHWEDSTDEMRAAWCDIARAVLQAIREPSERMVVAGEAWQMHCSDVDSLFGEMIKAALEEGL